MSEFNNKILQLNAILGGIGQDINEAIKEIIIEPEELDGKEVYPQGYFEISLVLLNLTNEITSSSQKLRSNLLTLDQVLTTTKSRLNPDEETE